MQKNSRLMKVLAAGAAVIIAVFFGIELYNIAVEPYKTEIAYEYTVYETCDIDYFVVRNESYVQAASGFTVVSLVDDTERVAGGSAIAAYFSNTATASDYTYLASLREKLEKYKKLNSQMKYANIDTDLLSSDIGLSFETAVNSIKTNDLSDFQTDKMNFLQAMTRKQISLGDEVDCSAVIDEISSEITALEATANPAGLVTAQTSGYYTVETDGFETLLSYDGVKDLTVADITAALEASEQNVEADVVGKIVESSAWYLATVIDTNTALTLDTGKKVTVFFGDTTTDAVVMSVYSMKNVDGECALVLKCSDVSKNTLSLRKGQAKLVVGEYTGLKVSKEAVRVVDDVTGVFVIRGNLMNFRRLDVIYSESGFVIAKANPDNATYVDEDGKTKDKPKHASLYDEVIVSGKDLKNGQLIR